MKEKTIVAALLPGEIRQLQYKGVNSSGVAVVGATQSTAANLTEALFGRRIRSATVIDTATGQVVGEVTKHPGTGKRTWWAEP